MPDTSIAQQIMMSNLSMSSQIMQGSLGVISNISNMSKSENSNKIADLSVKNSLGKLAYAVEGDTKYDKEIDLNNDGIISYSEYVRSINDRIASKYNVPKSDTTYSYAEDLTTGLLKFSVNNRGKTLAAYLKSSIQLPSGIIEREA